MKKKTSSEIKTSLRAEIVCRSRFEINKKNGNKTYKEKERDKRRAKKKATASYEQVKIREQYLETC